jgi:hypothetical protein
MRASLCSDGKRKRGCCRFVHVGISDEPQHCVDVAFLVNQRFFQSSEIMWLVFQGELFNAVKADDCFWSLGDNLAHLLNLVVNFKSCTNSLAHCTIEPQRW